jgi:hypothetical protein
VRILRVTSGGYELRHVDDIDLDPPSLAAIEGLEALEAVARRGPGGTHRALRTRPDLRRGWLHRVPDVDGLLEALVTLYGSAVVHWHAREEGTLVAGSFAATAGRQTGMYATLRDATASGVEDATRQACASHSCLRTRVWRTPMEEQAPRGARDDVPPSERKGTLVVPCPEPCPVLLAHALETRPGR